MGIFKGWFGGGARRLEQPAPRAPTASYADGGIDVRTSAELEQALRSGAVTGSGAVVTPDTAMRVAAVYASVRVISGAVATLPLHVKRRVDAKTREDASDNPLWKLLRRKPNRWQTPSQFRRMMQANVLLRGNGYALKVVSRGAVIELVPMAPDRVEVKQNDDLSLAYEFTRKDGRKVRLGQDDVFHLAGLTLDGFRGVSPITYARESIGLSLSMESHGAATFKNGARPSAVLKHPNTLGLEGQEMLRTSLDAYRSGGNSEGKALILEEGMEMSFASMSAEDVQWIEGRKFSRTDIAMFMGVPPSMLGDNSGSDSNWGTGLEQKSLGFIAYTLEDHLTMWEEAIGRDLIPEDEPDLYARFNRAALVKGDIKARWEAYVKGLQWGVYSPDEIRALEDENPRPDGAGGVYYDPPNVAGTPSKGADDVTD
jgi:HK97 family phage portal protein